MHDFLLAKEIVDQILAVVEEKKLEKISKVSLEIGNIALAHDEFPEHMEDISEENLRFGLENISKNTLLEGADFEIKKTKDENWKITDIVV